MLKHSYSPSQYEYTLRQIYELMNHTVGSRLQSSVVRSRSLVDRYQFFYPEEGGSRFLQNVGCTTDYMVSHSKSSCPVMRTSNVTCNGLQSFQFMHLKAGNIVLKNVRKHRRKLKNVLCSNRIKYSYLMT